MVERNELNRSLLTLLDENIANAHMGNQVSIVLKNQEYVLTCIHAYIVVKYKSLGLSTIVMYHQPPDHHRKSVAEIKGCRGGE